ncbi:MAG: protein TolQ [Halothiobacillaceae bacterium]
MSAETSVLDLVLEASWVVQLVMLVLLLASVSSWALIFHKTGVLRSARRQAERFDEHFWSGGSLNDYYDRISRADLPREGQEAIFEAGFREYQRLRRIEGQQVEQVVAGVDRAMRVSLGRQVERLEEALTYLATVGSISPYIGLFGTVWGIMTAFLALGNVSNPTLSTVAPAIAEALIATAMGLFAAIPAVIAYNRFGERVDALANRYEAFVDEFANLLQRQVGGR